MTLMRQNPDGSVTEIAPAVLACGCPWAPGRVTIGYEEHPTRAGRCRSYYCRPCRVTTYSEPDQGRGAALGR